MSKLLSEYYMQPARQKKLNYIINKQNELVKLFDEYRNFDYNLINLINTSFSDISSSQKSNIKIVDSSDNNFGDILCLSKKGFGYSYGEGRHFIELTNFLEKDPNGISFKKYFLDDKNNFKFFKKKLKKEIRPYFNKIKKLCDKCSIVYENKKLENIDFCDLKENKVNKLFFDDESKPNHILTIDKYDDENLYLLSKKAYMEVKSYSYIAKFTFNIDNKDLLQNFFILENNYEGIKNLYDTKIKIYAELVKNCKKVYDKMEEILSPLNVSKAI